MSEIQTSAETAIKFDAFYPYIWIKNIGDADCYVSNHSDIIAGDTDVAYLPAGDAVMIQANTDTVYVLGTTTVEAHAQGYADSPFLDIYSEGGAEPVLISKSITANGTYTASSDNVDGYSSVEVNVQMQRTVLYESTDYTYGAPVGQTINLADNLSKYNIICIVWGDYSDNTSTASEMGVNSLNDMAWFDVPYLLEQNAAHFAGYYQRWGIIEFTNTTFKYLARDAGNESTSNLPEVYKIIGYKW